MANSNDIKDEDILNYERAKNNLKLINYENSESLLYTIDQD